MMMIEKYFYEVDNIMSFIRVLSIQGYSWVHQTD